MSRGNTTISPGKIAIDNSELFSDGSASLILYHYILSGNGEYFLTYVARLILLSYQNMCEFFLSSSPEPHLIKGFCPTEMLNGAADKLRSHQGI